jgi:hypothetical protein
MNEQGILRMHIKGSYNFFEDNTIWGKFISISKAFQDQKTPEKGQKLQNLCAVAM